MTKEEILEEIKRTAVENEGKPLGERAFAKLTGIGSHTWRGRYWSRWGDACEEAGFKRNKLNEAYSDDYMIQSIISLARKIGQFPTASDMSMEKRNDPSFPSYEAFKRLGTANQRISRIREYATSHEEYSDILTLLPEAKHTAYDEYSDEPETEKTDGFVYMVREQHSKYYKIGKTFDVPRRHREIALELPGDMKKIHSIRTDDPTGIESYWHKRFENKRVKGEWFALTAEDIRAFKRRKFM